LQLRAVRNTLSGHTFDFRITGRVG
jgi:hypothetical protein